MKESELAQKFINYFSDLEIFKEVPTRKGICDIVVKNNHITSAIEVKTTLSMCVIEQALNNTRYFNYSYIAVPKNPTQFQKHICGILGIGILTIKEYEKCPDVIDEVLKPKLFRRIKRPELKDYMKDSVAGSRNERITKFGNSINQIKMKLKKTGPIELKELLSKECHYHWSSIYSARNCFVDLVRRGIIKDVVIYNSMVYLKE